MHAKHILAVLLLAVSTLGAAPEPGPFTFLFNVTLRLGKPYKPIQTPLGGLQLIAPIKGGAVAGPAAHATIAPGGVGYPVVNKRMTFQDTSIVLTGTANDDGSPFLVQEDGVGRPEDHWSRIIIAASGKYAYLQRNFILGHYVASAPGRVTVSCWCVDCKRGAAEAEE